MARRAARDACWRVLGAAGILLLAVLAETATAQSAAQNAATARLRRLVLVVPDTTRPPSYPDSSWREVEEVQPGRQAGVLVEFFAADSASAARLVDGLDVWLRKRGSNGRRDSTLLEAGFFGRPSCALNSCEEGGVYAAYGFLGFIPRADSVRVFLAPAGNSLGVWEREPSRFAFGASLGASVPLNAGAGREVVRRVGLNGRLLVGQVRDSALFRCELPWAYRILWKLLVVCPAQVLTLPAVFVPGARRWEGPFLLEGDFYLGLAALKPDSPTQDSAAQDTTASAVEGPGQRFEESSEGYVRIEFPLVYFGGDVSLRAFVQGGFVTVQSLPDYWVQRFTGLRLGMDAADLSGRQSYVEIGFGLSQNLRPPRTRTRVAVQLVVPNSNIAFHFTVNYSGNRSDVGGGDNPVVVSAFTSLDFGELFKLFGGNGAR